MKYDKGELNFYKGHTPKELEDLYNDIPEKQEKIMAFITDYQYNYTRKKWEKF